MMLLYVHKFNKRSLYFMQPLSTIVPASDFYFRDKSIAAGQVLVWGASEEVCYDELYGVVITGGDLDEGWGG